MLSVKVLYLTFIKMFSEQRNKIIRLSDIKQQSKKLLYLFYRYLYAARFVNLVKAKTPKITLYSDQAKCILMENSPEDFEVLFYSGKYYSFFINLTTCFLQLSLKKFFFLGGKVSKNGEVVKVIESSGHLSSYQMNEVSSLSNTHLKLQHFLQVRTIECLYLSFLKLRLLINQN